MKETTVTILAAAALLTACSDVQPLAQKEWETTNQERVSVHDPSITYLVDEEGKESYYIFGSHLAQAKSEDLLTWDVPFTVEYENMTDNIIYGDVEQNLAESFEWAGFDDADSSGKYHLWAPDVIWNDHYKWSDGSEGAYMIYYSASSTWRRSAIGFAVAKTIEGPFSYSDTVVYSGFTKEDSTDGSERNTHYKNTHIDDLIKEGKVSAFNDQWAIENGKTYNTDYAPNAIDPALFFDEENRLWMTYGSWSGGIYLLEMDAETGKPYYPGEDSQTTDGRVIDRYFGTKLSGGYHQSGEGPYIVYDPQTDYYYLFITYGGLSAKGGYNMRLFRSEQPDGPYIDAKGQSPIIEKGQINEKYGIKLLGNYQFSTQKMGYRAAGHNSAFIDKEGQWYLVFHTRFNNGSENHEVRVHHMLMNEDGWPVPVPYEYTGQDITANIDNNQVIGSYEVINHQTTNGKTMLPTETLSLQVDGTISGDYQGSWQMTTDGKITLVIEDTIYKGHFLRQTIKESGEEKLTFSAIGDNNSLIWASKND